MKRKDIEKQQKRDLELRGNNNPQNLSRYDLYLSSKRHNDILNEFPVLPNDAKALKALNLDDFSAPKRFKFPYRYFFLLIPAGAIAAAVVTPIVLLKDKNNTNNNAYSSADVVNILSETKQLFSSTKLDLEKAYKDNFVKKFSNTWAYEIDKNAYLKELEINLEDLGVVAFNNKLATIKHDFPGFFQSKSFAFKINSQTLNISWPTNIKSLTNTEISGDLDVVVRYAHNGKYYTNTWEFEKQVNFPSPKSWGYEWNDLIGINRVIDYRTDRSKLGMVLKPIIKNKSLYPDIFSSVQLGKEAFSNLPFSIPTWMINDLPLKNIIDLENTFARTSFDGNIIYNPSWITQDTNNLNKYNTQVYFKNSTINGDLDMSNLSLLKKLSVDDHIALTSKSSTSGVFYNTIFNGEINLENQISDFESYAFAKSSIGKVLWTLPWANGATQDKYLNFSRFSFLETILDEGFAVPAITSFDQANIPSSYLTEAFNSASIVPGAHWTNQAANVSQLTFGSVVEK